MSFDVSTALKISGRGFVGSVAVYLKYDAGGCSENLVYYHNTAPRPNPEHLDSNTCNSFMS